MTFTTKYNFLRYVPTCFYSTGNLRDRIISMPNRQYMMIFTNKRQPTKCSVKLSTITCLYSSDNKKHFITFDKKAEALKDVIEHKKEQLKGTEHRIRLKGEEIVRDLKHQKELTGQKLRSKKEFIIKDILETKAKVKERLEEVVEVS